MLESQRRRALRCQSRSGIFRQDSPASPDRGDSSANSAPHIIAIGRLRTDQRTREFVARRIADGHSKLGAIRAKRYLAREIVTLIMQRHKELNAARIAA